jgi:hypothetical protein
MATGARWSEHKHIVPIDVDFCGKVNGFDRSILAGNLAEVRKTRSGFKG